MARAGGWFGSWVPEAVVFDCDGLLMDTEPCWTAAETVLFARRGLTFGPEEKAMVIGGPMSVAAARWAILFGEPEGAELIEAEILGLVTEIIAAEAKAMPGARELVEEARSRMPVAIASNSPRSVLDVTLARDGLADLVPVTLAGDEVPAPKPAPDIYLAACERLDVRPGAALAFEDSEPGVRAAKAAGLRTVGVPTLDGGLSADVVIDSLTDVELPVAQGSGGMPRE